MKVRTQVAVVVAVTVLASLAAMLVAERAEASPLGAVSSATLGITRGTSELGLLLALNGSPTYLGRIGAGTAAKNNADATAFDIPADAKVLLIYASAAVRVLPDTDATEDITVANGVPIKADERFYMVLKANQSYLQAITAVGTADVDVWRLD